MKITGWPLMPAKCASCPFREGGDARLRAEVLSKILAGASQVCHHPRMYGRKETHLWRGARDEQLTIFHRLGWIAEPTDQAFAKASAKALSKGVQSDAV